jgi:hypothetical protein
MIRRPTRISQGRIQIWVNCGYQGASFEMPVFSQVRTRRCGLSNVLVRTDRDKARARLVAGNDGHDLERHTAAAAIEDLVLEEAQIVAFHQLEAAVEGRGGLAGGPQ